MLVMKESTPVMPTSKIKVTRSQSLKLNPIKSSGRILSRISALTPVTAISEVSSSMPKKSAFKKKTLASLPTVGDANHDLSRCLQEAVESMFSLGNHEVPTPSTSIADEDDVTLIKVSALSSTSLQKDQHSFIKYPDDVKIELISIEDGPTTEVSSSSENISAKRPSAVQSNKSRGSSLESPSISQGTMASSEKLAENKQTSNDITQCVTLSVLSDKSCIKLKSLTGAATMVTDTQPRAKSPTSMTCEVRSVIKVPIVSGNVKRNNKTGVLTSPDSKFGNITSILTPAGTQPVSRNSVLTSSDIKPITKTKILSPDPKSNSKAATVMSYIKPVTLVSSDTKANLTPADIYINPMAIALTSDKDEPNSMAATLVPAEVTENSATVLTPSTVDPDRMIASLVSHEDQLNTINTTSTSAEPKITATTSDVKSDTVVTTLVPASRSTTTMVTPSAAEPRTFIATLISPGGERQNITARILTPAEVKKNPSFAKLPPGNIKQNTTGAIFKPSEVESNTNFATMEQDDIKPTITSTTIVPLEEHPDVAVVTMEQEDIKPDITSTIPISSEVYSDAGVATMEQEDIKPDVTSTIPISSEVYSDAVVATMGQTDIEPDITSITTSSQVYPGAAVEAMVPLDGQSNVTSAAVVTSSGVKLEIESPDEQENEPTTIITHSDVKPEFEDTTVVPSDAESRVTTTITIPSDVEPSVIISRQLPDEGNPSVTIALVESSDVTPDVTDIRLLPANIEPSVVTTTFVPTEVTLDTTSATEMASNVESCGMSTTSGSTSGNLNTFSGIITPADVKTSTTSTKMAKPDVKLNTPAPFKSKNMISILSPLENAKSRSTSVLLPLTDVRIKPVDTELTIAEIKRSSSISDEIVTTDVKTKSVGTESLLGEVKPNSTVKTFKISDIKVVDNNSVRGKSILKTYLHPRALSEENTTKEKAEELSTDQPNSKLEGGIETPNSNTTPKQWEKSVSTLSDSEVKFSLNEFGLIEIDAEANGKGAVKPKSSDNVKDDSESSKIDRKEERIHMKSKIGILCKKGSYLGKRSLMKTHESSSDKSSGLDDSELIPKIKKLKKKIKSPITKTSETKEGLSSDNAKPSEDIFHCEGCGCYGLEMEFHSSRFCSIKCEEEWTRKVEADIKKEKDRIQVQIRRRKKKLMEKVQQEMEKMEARHLLDEAEKEIQVDVESATKSEPDLSLPLSSELSPESSSSKEEISNDGSNDLSKPRLPWQTGKHGFSWTRYLEYNKAKAAPAKLFKDPFPYSKNNFKMGMRLEGIDPKHPNYFCVLSVAEVCGFRIKLHFDGYSSIYDFWVNADSMDIFPPGWCEKNGYTLYPPPNYDEPVFNWSDYLKYCRSSPAPKGLFYNKSGDSICPNGFRMGMKLEAVDRQNTSLVCVASVAGLMDSRILVHFDGWDEIYNYWADPSSSYIHPVGWCEEHDHKLTPPSDWKSSEFTWEKYLVETKSMAAPARAFKQRVHGSFKRGLKLECVDKRMPLLVRVATVDDIREHQIRVKFDGWSDIYSYWVDEDSRDIHPMGWCQTVGHVLELPLTSEDSSLECPTPSCQGQGHVMGSKSFTNHTVAGCPYDPQILIKKEELPDRLTSTPEDSFEQVCIKEKKPNEMKNPIGRPAKWRKLEGNEKVSTDQHTEDQDSTEIHKEKSRKKRKISRTFSPGKKINVNSVSEELRQGVINPGYKPSEPDATDLWLKHAYPLNVYISSVPTENDITNWTEDHVIKLVSSISDSKSTIKMFKEHSIDGEAFSMMTQDDLVSSMGIKIGPALKIYNCIMLLRQRVKENRAKVF